MTSLSLPDLPHMQTFARRPSSTKGWESPTENLLVKETLQSVATR